MAFVVLRISSSPKPQCKRQSEKWEKQWQWLRSSRTIARTSQPTSNFCISTISLQNNLLPSGEKRKTVKTLVIDSVDRHEAGIYICEATNGVGVSHVKAEAKIKLQVLCEILYAIWNDDKVPDFCKNVFCYKRLLGMKSILEKHVKLHFHLRQNFECGASCSMLTF